MAASDFKPGLRLAIKFALRELRGGLAGFYIFIGCIALGVAAISGVNSVARAITSSIEAQGQTILGGDVSFSLVQRAASADELNFLNENGTLSHSITMRAMTRTLNGEEQTLVELKAVDQQYPLYGTLSVEGNSDAAPYLADNQAYTDQVLLDRLGIEPGTEVEIGAGTFTLLNAIGNEPDKIGDGVGFGPRVIISSKGLERTGLVQPGSLLRHHYKLRLENPTQTSIKALEEVARSEFPDAGWRIRSRANAAPALTRNVDRFSQFLTLVGLTALVVGGVGVANATRSFLEGKRPVIATLKSVGAPGGFIFGLYLLQILIIATGGIMIGLALGALMPIAAKSALSGILPITGGKLLFPQALIPGIAFGYLTTLVFAIWPLAVSRDVQATDLFRASSYAAGRLLPRWPYLIVLGLAISLLIAMAILLADNRFIATVFVAAITVAFVLLRVVAYAIQWLARNSPAVSSTPLRMAIANIHRPGSLTPSITLSLGLGLALLVSLASIDGNLRSQISNNLPEQAPDFFFVDIQNHEIESFRETLTQISPDGKVIAVPMLRGRVTALRGIPAEEYKTEQGGEWVLRGDRGITYAKNTPENSTLSKGEWWPADYSGPPLVSVSSEEAGELGLDIGDIVSVNVLGRTIEAEIASLRDVQWESLGVNFVFVFSPNTFAGAPHSFMATLSTDEQGVQNSDGALLKTLSRAFPTVTAVRVRDALETVNKLVGQLSTAIRAAAVVALLTSVLVLAGALAAGNRERIHDAVVMKTLGATRGTLIKTLVLEYTLLGIATAVFAILAGTLAAWFVISVIMQVEFLFLPDVAVATMATALAFTIIFGLVGTWRILGQKPANILREL